MENLDNLDEAIQTSFEEDEEENSFLKEQEEIADIIESKEEHIQIDKKTALKLDYSIPTQEGRVEYVNKILANLERKPTAKYLEILGSYIMDAMTKEERKASGILTENRMVTINKRETSYEGLVEKFENGEDGVYNLIINDKNVLLTPKVSITEKDIEEVPGLKELRAAIDRLEKMYPTAKGKDKFTIKKHIIEMRKTQYILKDTYYQPVKSSNLIKSISAIPLDEHITFDEDGEPVSDCIVTFFNPKHVSALLCNYSALKQETENKVWSDFYYLMMDFDNLCAAALADYPLYEALVTYKIDGLQNIEIQQRIENEFGIKHSVEYISSLWRNKIPKIISEKAKEEYIIWYYTYKEYGKWKKCSRCGQIKLAHNRFFSKNKTSKDGFYSICKCCRNKKTDKEV